MQSKEYLEGQAEFLKTKSNDYNCPYQEVGQQRTDWHYGYSHALQKYVEDVSDNFIKELTEVCKKYNGYISTGCGCCGGASMKDDLGITRELSFNIGE